MSDDTPSRRRRVPRQGPDEERRSTAIALATPPPATLAYLASGENPPGAAERDLAAILAIVDACAERDRLVGLLQALDWDRALQVLPTVRCALCGSPEVAGELGLYAGGEVVMHQVCQGCLDTRERRQKTARRMRRRVGLRSALARARAARLPATLTENEWSHTIEYWGDACAFCRQSDWAVLSMVVPITAGGGAVYGNCVPCCYRCHNKEDRDASKNVAHWAKQVKRLLAGEYIPDTRIWRP